MSVQCVASDKNKPCISMQPMPQVPTKNRKKMTCNQPKQSFQLLLFAFLAFCLNLARAVSLNLLSTPSTLNASHYPPHSYHCNSLPSWTGGSPGSPTYKSEDCNQAIRMFEQDVVRHPGTAQWLSLGFPHTVPGYGAPVWTPKRYTSGELLVRPYTP